MDRFETEEQQIEAIKQFWKDNGTAVVIGVVVGLGGLWGWGTYAESQIKAKEQASVAYQETIEEMLESGDTTKAADFITENKNNIYAELAGLIAAQQSSNSDDHSAAIETLKGVASAGGQLADIANLRLSTVYFENGDTQQALASLDKIQSSAYDDQKFEMKGDLLFADGQYDAAESAYNKALVELPGDMNIQMKLDNIAYARANIQVETAEAEEEESNQGE